MLDLSKTERTLIQGIAQIIVKAMRYNFRYLTEELMPLCLLSKASCLKEKKRMTFKLFGISSRHTYDELLPQKPTFPSMTDDTVLHDLLRNRSALLFQGLKFKMEAIQLSFPMPDGKSYQFMDVSKKWLEH